ncbi:hemolin-like [Leguminivora glycinivorella]|uniref:hemolin-like n=1 Tax=Leguminivora glycinivorella TaxID=1035111 RepID=UPI00200E3D28|nr:hemolin-like [Leguminivora glycinivorella]
MAAKVFLLFAASAALCGAQPVDNNLPVLKESPPEVTFRADAKPHFFSIPCALTAVNDKVVFTWTKNGKPFPLTDKTQGITIRANEGTIIFNNPQDSDEGVYQCQATSPEGVATSRPIHVKKTFVEIPKFTLQKHTPEEGKPFKMECSVTKAYPKPVIEWYRQGKDGKYVDIMEKRLLESPEGDLYFTNVTKEDVSKDVKYVCLVATQAADDKLVAAEHIIEDLTPAKGPKSGELTPLYLSKDLTVKTGDIAVMMYCIYGGTPMAHPDWFKISPDGTRTNVNGKPGDRVTHRNRSAGRRLWITKVLAEDDATYECVANNGVGKPQSHKIKLTVQQAPEFTQQPEPVMLAKVGDDVTIPCKVRGAKKISWVFNGQPLQVKEPADTLTLSKVQKKDNGYYACSGSSDLGEVYAETLLHIA